MNFQIHKESWLIMKAAITQFECKQVGFTFENKSLKLKIKRENTTDFKITNEDLEIFINLQIKLN
jgi:hypothetical protein